MSNDLLAGSVRIYYYNYCRVQLTFCNDDFCLLAQSELTLRSPCDVSDCDLHNAVVLSVKCE